MNIYGETVIYGLTLVVVFLIMGVGITGVTTVTVGVVSIDEGDTDEGCEIGCETASVAG